MRFQNIILCALLWCVLPAWGEVGVISVTDENKHAAKEDFVHTFEYFILPAGNLSKEGRKCQATRITRGWFATAAHCVTGCQGGCQIQIDLLEQDISALVVAEHTPKKPVVFSMPGYSSGTFVKNDFALIRLDVNNAPSVYYMRDRASGSKRQISRRQFQKFLNENSQARRALYRVMHPDFPPLVLFDKANYLLDRKLSVVSIFDGVRTVKKNPYPVHYVKELGFAYTNDFGIRKGMSGSGVMTNTGELIGLISGIFQTVKVPPDNPAASKVESEYFMFFVFNKEAKEFMKEVMGSDFDKLDWKDAYPSFVFKSRRNYASIIERVNATRHRNGKTPNR